jgi:hypothetical protein
VTKVRALFSYYDSVTLLLGFLGLRFQVGGLRDNVVPEVSRLGEKHGAQCDATKVVIEYVDDRFEQGHDRYCKNDFLRIRPFS